MHFSAADATIPVASGAVAGAATADGGAAVRELRRRWTVGAGRNGRPVDADAVADDGAADGRAQQPPQRRRRRHARRPQPQHRAAGRRLRLQRRRGHPPRAQHGRQPRVQLLGPPANAPPAPLAPPPPLAPSAAAVGGAAAASQPAGLHAGGHLWTLMGPLSQ